MNVQAMDLSKWTEKTVQAVRRICGKKQAPCIAFGLIFFDPTAPKHKNWSYVIELAFDPHNPPSEKELTEVRKALEFISRGVGFIMGGESQECNLDDFVREARWDQ